MKKSSTHWKKKKGFTFNNASCCRFCWIVNRFTTSSALLFFRFLRLLLLDLLRLKNLMKNNVEGTIRNTNTNHVIKYYLRMLYLLEYSFFTLEWLKKMTKSLTNNISLQKWTLWCSLHQRLFSNDEDNQRKKWSSGWIL